MISSAAASVSGSHALGLGAQAAPADDAAVSTDFAALLGTTVTSGAVPDAAAGQDGVTDQATLLKQAIGKQMRQASDGASGKKLPQGLPDTADGLTDAAKPADGAAEAAAPDGTASALLPIATEIVLPGFVVPISMPMPQTPPPATTAAKGSPASTAVPANAPVQAEIKQSTTESLAQTAAAQAIRSPLPGATQPAIAAKAATAIAAAQQAPAPATQVAASPAPPQAAPAIAVSLAVTPAKTDSTIAMPAVGGEPAPAIAILASSPMRADEIRVSIAPAGQPAPAATSTSAQLASAQAAGQAIGQIAGRAAVTAKAAAPEGRQPVATTSPDAAASMQAAANAPQPSAGGTPRREATAQSATPPAADAPAARAGTAAAEVPAVPAQAPAPVAQPLFGLQDGQPFSQTAAPVTSASTASSIGQTGHDFAALVDRLVEARDAAAPASVHAAITHSEFGQVSLRFDQDANGLSVAMSSADPEFARAVQASSAQSQMSGDNANDRGSGASRQDTSGQPQTTGTPSGQSQAQSSASGRGDRNSPTQTDTRAGRTSGQPTQDADTADARGGIYA